MRQEQIDIKIIDGDNQLARPIEMIYLSLPAKTQVAEHEHLWGQVLYSYQGALDVTIASGRYLLPPHRALWLPPCQAHAVGSTTGAKLASIYIDNQQAQPLPSKSCVFEVTSLIREMIKTAVKIPKLYHWESADGRLLRALRDQLAMAKLTKLYLPMPINRRLLIICEHLQEDPGCQHTLADWGNKIGSSPRTIQRLFKQGTGMSFSQWRQELRLHKALERLAVEDVSILTLALDLGYENSSSFIEMFKFHMGISPGNYLKSCR